MKKVIFLVAALFILQLSFKAQAQSKTGVDYFIGTWNVVVKGTPNGDAKMFFVFEKKDSTLTGIVQDSTGKQISQVEKADVNGDKATVYFTAAGYDLNLEMNKKDDDHITGSLLGMFDAVGDRVKLPKSLSAVHASH